MNVTLGVRSATSSRLWMRLRSMKSGVNADTAIGVFSSLVSRFCAVTITSSSPIDGSLSAAEDAASDESAAASAFAITFDGNMAAAASPNVNTISATAARYATDLMPALPHILITTINTWFLSFSNGVTLLATQNLRQS